jgi:hypothetical protein
MANSSSRRDGMREIPTSVSMSVLTDVGFLPSSIKNAYFHFTLSPASPIAARLSPPDHPPTTSIHECFVVVGWSGGRRAKSGLEMERILVVIK